MGAHYIQKVITPSELREAYPLKEELKQRKERRDRQIARIFAGDSDLFLVIIDPCLGWEETEHLLLRMADLV